MTLQKYNNIKRSKCNLQDSDILFEDDISALLAVYRNFNKCMRKYMNGVYYYIPYE
jgi:hypothetical protein